MYVQKAVSKKINWQKISLSIALLSLPLLTFANEGQKIMHGLYELIMMAIAFVVFVIILPMFYFLPKGKPRFYGFTFLNFLLLGWLLSRESIHYDFNWSGSGGVLIVSLAIQFLYSWYVFRRKSEQLDETVLDQPFD
ncbi:MAG: hypothetical protein AB8G15_20595 [Saprospiraceae bacterium]